LTKRNHGALQRTESLTAGDSAEASHESGTGGRTVNLSRIICLRYLAFMRDVQQNNSSSFIWDSRHLITGQAG